MGAVLSGTKPKRGPQKSLGYFGSLAIPIGSPKTIKHTNALSITLASDTERLKRGNPGKLLKSPKQYPQQLDPEMMRKIDAEMMQISSIELLPEEKLQLQS